MAFTLGPKATAGGYRIASYATIGSTSTEALERARAGDSGRLWIAALAQTAGHGRRGRAWQTPGGNLAASLLVRASASPALTATLGFAAGLALENAIQSCATLSSPGTGEAESARSAEPGESGGAALHVRDPHPLGSRRVGLSRPGRGGQLRLKWPNDVLIDGAKVAGILLQAVSSPGAASSVVIGFGVNVLHAPVDLPYPATSLFAADANVSAEQLFAALAEAWTEQDQLWDDGRGFGVVRDRWLERAAGLGEPIAVHLGEAVLRGRFETIDDQGQLVLKAEDGTLRRVAAGDVHFGTVSTMGAVQYAG